MQKKTITTFSLDKKLTHSLRFLRVCTGKQRFAILALLKKHHAVSVGSIAQALRGDISKISHQLHLLRKEGVVVARKEGKFAYYSLAQPKFFDKLLALTEK